MHGTLPGRAKSYRHTGLEEVTSWWQRWDILQQPKHRLDKSNLLKKSKAVINAREWRKWWHIKRRQSMKTPRTPRDVKVADSPPEMTWERPGWWGKWDGFIRKQKVNQEVTGSQTARLEKSSAHKQLIFINTQYMWTSMCCIVRMKTWGVAKEHQASKKELR